jgi:hypothetical protein
VAVTRLFLPDGVSVGKKRFVSLKYETAVRQFRGRNRVIVKGADPATFRRLAAGRWGLDRSHVFYEATMLQGLDVQKVQVLHSPDTADRFVNYVKDDERVFFGADRVNGADAKTFSVIVDKVWDAADRKRRYRGGQ